MIIHEMPQLSDEWFAVRTGRITGTSFTTMANGKKDSVETLCLKTAAERLTGASSEEPYTNPAMENGTNLESLARETYEATNFTAVQTVGFIELDEYIGCSPDGLVSDDGGVEIKAPMAHTHLKYLNDRKLPTTYKYQVQGALWITGRDWWDWVSFNPLFPPNLQMLIVRVLPDKKAFEMLTSGADYCRKRIDELVEVNRV